MGAKKACSTGDQDTLFEMHSRYFAVGAMPGCQGHACSFEACRESGPSLAQAPAR
jgi:hypothetical protein